MENNISTIFTISAIIVLLQLWMTTFANIQTNRPYTKNALKITKMSILIHLIVLFSVLNDYPTIAIAAFFIKNYEISGLSFKNLVIKVDGDEND